MQKANLWFKGLSRNMKIVVVSAATLVGVGAVDAVAGSSDSVDTVPQSNVIEKVPKPVVRIETVIETEAVPFEKTSMESNAYSQGETQVTVTGVNGVRTKTYEIIKTDGRQTGHKLLKEEVTTQPVTEVTTIGTYVKPAPVPRSNCDPNYSGACVPVASDVDCASGSGNGPAYVSGPIYVVGTDIYDLDRNGDGVGCED